VVVDFGAERDHDPGIFDGMFANLGHGKLWECLGGGLRSWMFQVGVCGVV